MKHPRIKSSGSSTRKPPLSCKRIYEDNVSGKLSDERFIKLSHDYELEQANLKAATEALRKDLKQQKKQKINLNSFLAAVRKYTDRSKLDATVLRKFVDKILILEVYTQGDSNPRVKVREIRIAYNFIGAFDLNRHESNPKKERKSA